MIKNYALKIWILLIGLEVLAGINAGIVFRIFERAVAGYVAGSVFLLLGIAALFASAKHSLAWRPLNLIVSGVYALGFSLPLVLARLTTPYPAPVESVFGLPLEIFHRGSEASFALLFAITMIQIGFGIKQKNKTRA